MGPHKLCSAFEGMHRMIECEYTNNKNHFFLEGGWTFDRQFRRQGRALERLFGPRGRIFEQANFQKVLN